MGKKIANYLGNNFKYYYGSYYTNYEGYDITLRYDYTSLLYNMYFNVSGPKNIEKLNTELSKIDAYLVAKYSNNTLTITQACDRQKDMPKLVNNVLKEIVKYLKKNKYKNLCKICNNEEKTTLISVDDNINYVCNKCIKDINKKYEKELKERKNTKEKILFGIIGSIVGSLPGFILWSLLSYLMINPTVCALLIMFGSAYCYRYMAKSMKVPGLIISILIGFIFIMIANEFTSAYTLYNEYINQYNINIFDAYKALPYYINMSEGFKASYNQNLLLSIMFFIFGSFTNFGIFRRYIVSNKVKKMEV